jgi:hypothetical protein
LSFRHALHHTFIHIWAALHINTAIDHLCFTQNPWQNIWIFSSFHFWPTEKVSIISTSLLFILILQYAQHESMWNKCEWGNDFILIKMQGRMNKNKIYRLIDDKRKRNKNSSLINAHTLSAHKLITTLK